MTGPALDRERSWGLMTSGDSSPSCHEFPDEGAEGPPDSWPYGKRGWPERTSTFGPLSTARDHRSSATRDSLP